MSKQPSTTSVIHEPSSLFAVSEYSRYNASVQPSTIRVTQEPSSWLASELYSV